MVAADRLSHLEGLLVILYGDCPLVRARTLEGLVAAQQSSQAAGTILTAIMDDPTGYGRVLRDSQDRCHRRGGAEGRHAGTTRHSRGQHGPLLLSSRTVLEAYSRAPAQ
jgi:CTP:molybdopterin cytidylyltransferase MocA